MSTVLSRSQFLRYGAATAAGVALGVSPGMRTALAATRTAVADSYVRDGSFANDNFGTDSVMWVKTASTGVNRRAYLKFDLSGIGSVTAATLRLYVSAIDATTEVQAKAVSNTSWSETGITWNNKPATGTVLDTTTINTGQVDTWVEFDVTSQVAAQAGGLMSLALVSTGSTSGFVVLRAREQASFAPELVITEGGGGGGGWQVQTIASTARKFGNNPRPNGLYDSSVDMTFVSWGGSGWNPYVQSYNHSDDTWSSPKQVGTVDNAADSHYAPAMIQASDGRLLVFHGAHSPGPGSNSDTVKVSRAPNPHSISGTWTQQEVSASLGATYPFPVRVANGDIYVFYRVALTVSNPGQGHSGDDRPIRYLRSTDNGQTWVNSVTLAGELFAFGSIDRSDNMNEIYLGMPSYEPSTNRIHLVACRV